MLFAAENKTGKFTEEIKETCDDLFDELDLSQQQIVKFKEKIATTLGCDVVMVEKWEDYSMNALFFFCCCLGIAKRT